MTALALLLVAAPAHAQQTAPATTNQATPAPTPSPTPSPGTVGNPALQNFNLDGTVTREATPTPAPAPASTPKASPPASSAPASAPPSAPAPDVAPSAPVRRDAPVASGPSAPVDDAPVAGVAPDVPGAPDAAAPRPEVTPDLMPPTAPVPSGGSFWPWLAALAVALAAAGAWWLRRQRTARDEALAYAGHAPEVAAPAPSAPREAKPQPAPRADPVPPPPPADGITARVQSPGIEGGIVSRVLQPKLAFELQPLKFETDDKNNVRLTFELAIVNIGSAPARDIRVEAKMFNAGPHQDQQIVQFFRSPGAMGAKIPPIAPRDRVPLRSRIGMTAAEYQALDLGGRSLVVPMIAVNAIYRGTAGETQESASWLVGALPPGGEAEKLKPFPLDRPIAATQLAARVHSAGLQNQA